MIDVRKMNGIAIDAARETARLGAGCLLGDVAVTLFEQKFALPAGSCRPVGVAGLTLGGGHGLSSRKFGLTCDNLISAHLVDANGNEMDANREREPGSILGATWRGRGEFWYRDRVHV